MDKLNSVAACDFKFFKAFVNGDDGMYEKFIKGCPSELEGIATIRAIVESFKKNVLEKCSFIVLCNSVLPAINNITVCRNFFLDSDEDTEERKNFRNTFKHEYSEKDNVLKYADCVIYSFLENVMDVDKTGKDKAIPWKHLPCLPIYIENEEIYSTFDFSFVFDDDGQTYLNRYNKEFKLIERAPYKKLNFGG